MMFAIRYLLGICWCDLCIFYCLDIDLQLTLSSSYINKFVLCYTSHVPFFIDCVPNVEMHFVLCMLADLIFKDIQYTALKFQSQNLGMYVQLNLIVMIEFSLLTNPTSCECCSASRIQTNRTHAFSKCQYPRIHSHSAEHFLIKHTLHAICPLILRQS